VIEAEYERRDRPHRPVDGSARRPGPSVGSARRLLHFSIPIAKRGARTGPARYRRGTGMDSRTHGALFSRASHMHDAINLRKLGPRVAMAPRPQPFLFKKCLIFSLNDKNMLICPSSSVPTSRLMKGPLRRVRRTGRNQRAPRDVWKKIRRVREAGCRPSWPRWIESG
jgi:hypothetical protein